MTEMTVAEAAANQGVAETTIRRRLTAGQLAPGGEPGTVLVDKMMVEPPFHAHVARALRARLTVHGGLRGGRMELDRMSVALVDAEKLRQWLEAQGR